MKTKFAKGFPPGATSTDEADEADETDEDLDLMGQTGG
jgi:hypothetical protein